MNITIKYVRSADEAVSEIVKQYAALLSEVKKEHPDVTVSIEVYDD